MWKATLCALAITCGTWPGLALGETDPAAIPCGSNGPVLPGGERIDTKGAHIFSWLAHGVLKDRTEATLQDGYIVPLEKRPRPRLQGYDSHHLPYLKRHAELADDKKVKPKQLAERERLLSSAFDDLKAQELTHVTRFDGGASCGLYNAHGQTDLPLCAGGVERPKPPGFTNGMQALHETLPHDLRRKLATGDYTHILFMSMGWNNDPRVSVCRYRTIAENIHTAMEQRGKSFRPLIVGMTWPSSWFAGTSSNTISTVGHVGSIFNKANDSDEVGLLYGNIVLNRVIPFANRGDLPVIVIGHSMGARVAGQALFARDLLRQGTIGPEPDLAVFLQPAHSIYRYVRGRGVEGSPYDGFKALKTTIAVTASRQDSANPLAVWSKYMGGLSGLNRGGNYDDLFEMHWEVKASGTPSFPTFSFQINRDHKVNYFDARFIQKHKKPGPSGHNDILDLEMGAFIAHLITQCSGCEN